MIPGINLSTTEIHDALSSDALRSDFSPIVGPKSCAAMLGVSRSTLYFWIEHGQLRGAHRRRGKRQFLWRDRALLLIFNGRFGNQPECRRLRAGDSGIGLSDEEINAAFADGTVRKRFGPILSPDQVRELFGLSRSTIYFWTQQGHFAGAVVKRGKRQLFWRNRTVAALFNGPDWSETNA